jgi:cell division protease FtsH
MNRFNQVANMNDKLKPPLGNQSLNRRHIVWFLVVWMFLIFIFRGFAPAPSAKEISYTDFKKRVDRGEVTQITIKGNQISGKFKLQNSDKELQQPQNGNSLLQFFQDNQSQPDYFQTTKPALQDSALLPLLEKNAVVIRAETQKQSWLAMLIITLLPWLLIFGLLYYASRKMQERMAGGAGSGIFGFAKSKARLFIKTNSKVRYDKVAGLDNAKKELLEIVAYLQDPSRFQKLGGELPSG